MSYDKEPEQHDVDDVFNNAPSALKKTKRSNILLKQLRKKAKGNQWLKVKKGQRKRIKALSLMAIANSK